MYPRIISILSAAAVVAAAVLITERPKGENLLLTGKRPVASQGELTETAGRKHWEQMRLADPATGEIPRSAREKEMLFARTLPSDKYADAFGKQSLSWNHRGPWNVGGRTRALAIDATNENIILAGCVSGGVWRSADGGSTWLKTTASFPGAVSIVQDTRPGKTNTWYYASGEPYGASASGGGAFYLGNGIYKSVDGGVTWDSIPSTASNTPATYDSYFDINWNLVTDPSDSMDVLYLASVSGISKSTDGGASWSNVLGFSNPDSYFTDVAITSAGVVYATLSSEASGQKGLWRSADGVSWTDITPSGWPVSYNRIVIGIAPANENEVYFLGETPGTGKLIINFDNDSSYVSLWKYTYLSGDGSGTGGSWEDRSANIPADSTQFGKFDIQGGYDLLVKVKPDNSNVVFIGGTNLFRSGDGFATDTNTAYIGGYLPGTALPVVESYPNHHPDQHQLLFLPSNPYVMFSANDGGIWKTTNGMADSVSWVSLNDGYITSLFYTVAFDVTAAGSNILIGGLQDNGSYFTNSAALTDPWVTPSGGDGSFCAIADNGNTYYFSSQNSKIRKVTLDANGNKTAFRRIDPIGGKGYIFINPFVIDPNNNNIMYLAGGNRIWRNDSLSQINLTNEYDSISTGWVKFQDSLPITGSKITAMAVCRTPANRLYFGTSVKKVYRIDNANNGTPSPVDITSSSYAVNFPSGYVSCVAVDPDNGDNVMAIFSNYNCYSLFYSKDAGTSWEKCGGNIEQTPTGSGNGPSVRWASILPVSNGKVYFIGTSIGLFATDSLQGLNTQWVQQGTDAFGNVVVDMVETRLSDGLVAVATHGSGIYTANITDISQISGYKNVFREEKTNIYSYPNPFGNISTIEFYIPEPQWISTAVADKNGKMVVQREPVVLSAGKKSLSLDASGLPDGVYFFILRGENFTKSQKLLVIH